MAKRVPGYQVPPLREPGYRLVFEPSQRRVRAELGGEIVADSKRAMLLLETDHLPVYYFPEGDLRLDLMEPSERTTHCPYKGDATYWTVRAGGRVAEDAAWGYPEPREGAPDLCGYRAFYWDALDHWYEEDEEVFVHPRDPYRRVDVLPSSRHVEVIVGGDLVAESRRPRLLFETGLRPRYYLPAEDVRTELLRPSSTLTRCPYKGLASHWSLELPGERREDLVWSYLSPLAPCREIGGYYCFYDEQCDEVRVDGEPVA